MKNRNLGVNALLNIIKSCLSIIFPLITYPYALRVIGVDKIGLVSYVTSIVSYFSLFAMLGVTTYAIREGAKIRDSKEEFSKFANELFTINLITTIFATIIFIITVILVPQFNSHWPLFLLLGSSIIFTTIGVDWINTVFEDYLFITIRSIIIQLCSLVLLFLFVKNTSDYYKYAFLQIFTTGTVCITNWFYCRKYTRLRITIHPNIKRHLPRLLVLFANSLAVSIYVNFDTTMLGWIKGEHAVGIYAASTRIYGAIKSIMMAIYTVTIPRLASLYGKNDLEGFKTLYTKLWRILSILLIPAGVGLICVSNEIILLFGGEQYSEGVLSLQILAGALIFSIFGGLITTCLNVTIKREKDNLNATILSALINCGLNVFFISCFSYNGAAFTTLVAEFFVLVFCYVRLPNKDIYIERKNVAASIVQAMVASLPFVIITMLVRKLIHSSSLVLLTTVAISVVTYMVLMMVMKNTEVMSVVISIQKKINSRGEKE